MVKITNGQNIFEVTNGAYENIYKKQGYKVIGQDNAIVIPAQTLQGVATKTVDHPKVQPIAQPIKPIVAQPEPDTENTDKSFIDDIVEKPIALWNKYEVKRFANIMDISLAGTANIDEAKELIKPYINN